MKQFTSFRFVWYKLRLLYNGTTVCFCLLLFFPFCLFSQAPAIQWDKTIGGIEEDNLFSLQQTFDGGYILGGRSNSPRSGDKSGDVIGGSSIPWDDYWVVKLDQNGNKIWDKTIGGDLSDGLTSLQQTNDGGYILGGYSDSYKSGDKTQDNKGFYDYDYWVVKLDANGNIQWDKTIGGIYNDRLLSIRKTNGGGYILGGTSMSPISGDKTQDSRGGNDYWVVKLDEFGNQIWDKTIGGNDDDDFNSLWQTNDGGYILGGTSQSSISGDKMQDSRGGGDYWVVKLDQNGNQIWDKTIGGSSSDELHSLQQTNDGGYILGGSSWSRISGDKMQDSRGGDDYWVVKLDEFGNQIWDKTIGGSSSDNLYSLQQTNGGGYILGGYSWSPISGDKTQASKGGSDYWVVKLDQSGNQIWDKTIGGNDHEFFSSLQQTKDGGFILGGHSNSNKSEDKSENGQGLKDYWTVKLGAEPSITLNCPANVIANTETGKCYAMVNNIDPVITPVGATTTINYKLEKNGLVIEEGNGSASSKQFTTGITTITYTLADDPAQTCSFTVTVNDAEAPVLTCTNTIINLCFTSNDYYTIPSINMEDNCGIATIQYKIIDYHVIDENGHPIVVREGTGSDASGPLYIFTGSHFRDRLIVWDVQDINGNWSFCSFGIEVNYELNVSVPDVLSATGVSANTLYLGYGLPSLTLSASATGGRPGYSYYWELVHQDQSTTPLGTQQSFVISPIAAGIYNYKVTVTDASGCIAEFTKTITVVDIHSGQNSDKVYICHGESKGKKATLSVPPGSVANHLAHGDYLGTCNNTASRSEVLTRDVSETRGQEIIQKGFKIYPNPATHFLDVQWKTTNSSQTSISIFNIEGRVVKTIATQGAVNQKRISLNGLAKGVYMLVLKTGAEQQVSKFVIR